MGCQGLDWSHGGHACSHRREWGIWMDGDCAAVAGDWRGQDYPHGGNSSDTEGGNYCYLHHVQWALHVLKYSH